VNSLIARKCPPPYHDDEQGPVDRAMPPALVAVSDLRPGLAMEATLPPVADATTEDSAVDATRDPAPLPSARGVQQRWAGTDPNQLFGSKTLAGDPSLVVPVIASPEDVFRARELREQLKKKYLNRPSQPCSRWCVGID